MRILVLLSAFSTLAAAFKTHFLPSTISTSQLLILNNNPTASEYRDQDSKGFYSYGYKGELSAKAEYTTTDGSSKGFYSYVDADGKLQTVKYEASRMQGFKATASNLPTAPMDTNRAPEPVKDTPEVQLARQAHFDAYREAALKAALSPDNGNGEDIRESIDFNANDQQHQQMQLQRQQQQQQQHQQTQLQLQQQERKQINSELQHNTRDLFLSQQHEEEEYMNHENHVNHADHEGHENLYKMQQEQQQQQQQGKQQKQEAHHHQQRQQQRHQMKESPSQQQQQHQQQQQQHQQHRQQSTQNHLLTTVYKLDGDLNIDSSPLSELRTVYRVNNIDSNAELKLPIASLSELADSTPLTILQSESHPTLLTASSYEPTSTIQYQYHIGSPTVLTTLPHIESVHLNEPVTQLQLGTTTYLSSHRLSGKSII